MVNGYTVDLRPLMSWWTEPKGARPLSAWKHVRGSIEEDTALGWKISGKAGDKEHATSFFLKNPPRDRLRRFHELQRLLPEYDQARAATEQILQQPVHSFWDFSWMSFQRGGGISRPEYDQATQQLKVLHQNIQNVSTELAPMQDEARNFKLDSFALQTAESYQGLPVFDYGYPLITQ
jgi:hypothetical protein